MLVLAETSDQSLSFYDTCRGVKSTCFIYSPIYEMGSNKNNLPPAEITKLKRDLAAKLELSHSYAFLILIQPASGSYIARPDWFITANGQRQFPSIFLRGTGNYIDGPYKWHQILGENTPGYFSSETSGYLLYKANRENGGPVVQPNDFSFSVEYKSQAAGQGALYTVDAEFHYDLMPIPIQSIIDASVQSWNPGLARVTLIPETRLNSNNTQEARANYYSQGSVTSLTRSDIIGILGLVLSFAQFVIAVAAL